MAIAVDPSRAAPATEDCRAILGSCGYFGSRGGRGNHVPAGEVAAAAARCPGGKNGGGACATAMRELSNGTGRCHDDDNEVRKGKGHYSRYLS